MKKILASLIIIAFSFAANAQFAGSLRVENTTKCEVHYTVVGGTTPCGALESIIFTIPPVSTVTHTAASLGWPGISGARQYPVKPGCGTPIPLFYPFGVCPGSGLSILLYSVNSSCVRCVDNLQFWGHYTPEVTPGGIAVLKFVP